MHELGYCEGVLRAVETRAIGRPVTRVGVRVGAFHRIMPEAFQQSFELLAAGGVANGASTDVTVVLASARCRSCEMSFEASDPAPACPQCGALDVDTEGGDDLVLEWIEYHQPVGVSMTEGL